MLILLTGASGAGKSTYARELAKRLSEKLAFISTEIPDSGIKANPDRLRSEGFAFYERFTDIGGLDISGGAAVLDCICNLTANEMFDDSGCVRENAHDSVLGGVLRLAEKCEFLIVVTNEIASDGGGYGDEVKAYTDTLSAINRKLASLADCVYELCVGFPISLKSKADF